jgi:hypothetical protein
LSLWAASRGKHAASSRWSAGEPTDPVAVTRRSRWAG